MNHQKAYNGLAIVYRNLHGKAAKMSAEYTQIKAKADVLSSADPQLAYYIDANYRLSTDMRTLEQALAECRSSTERSSIQLSVLQKGYVRAQEALVKEKRKYKVSLALWVAGDTVLALCAALYMFYPA
jgi:hypothetical protein